MGATKEQETPVARSFKTVEQPITYEALESHVGEEIIVHTKFKTVRRGKLVHYTRVGLVVKLAPKDGGIELSMPLNTIRDIRLLVSPTEEGQPGAQTN